MRTEGRERGRTGPRSRVRPHALRPTSGAGAVHQSHAGGLHQPVVDGQLDGEAHAVRREGWDDGVRATVLCPSYIATDFLPGPQAISRDAMTQPEDLARIVALLLSLPNQASVAELLVNCRYEDMV